MVRQVDKVLEVKHSGVVPEVAHDAPGVVRETLVLKLFDIDTYTEPERPVRIDLDLDQLEDAEE